MNSYRLALPQSSSALAALFCSASMHAAATQYDCTDERGVRHRMPQRIESGLIQFTCKPAEVSQDAFRPVRSEPRRYSRIMLTPPASEFAAAEFRLATPALELVTPERPVAALHIPHTKLDAMIHATARQFGHDPNLLRAIIKVESGFNVHARSPKGAVGLMQLMPATARRFGWEGSGSLYSPSLNIEVGARYLAYLRRLFPDNPELMIAAYNAGEGAVAKYNNRVPPYPETRSYVQLVLAAYRSFRSQEDPRR